MTLDEAIDHAEEVADSVQCQSCADEHRQLAAWLRELRDRREMEVTGHGGTGDC